MAVLTLMVFVAGITLATIWAHSNNLLTVSAQPQKYTELYFTKPASLPSVFVNGRTYTFAFSVANHEAASQKYRYRVVVTQGNGKPTTSTGVLAVGNGKTGTHTASITISSDNQPVLVSVNLVGKAQSIHFKGES
jgi:Protein of unknown function (DUF1616).